MVTGFTALMDGGQLAEMEAALRARLVAAFPETTFKHETLPPRLTQAAWDRITQTPPVIGLGFVKMTPSTQGGTWRGVAHWHVVAVVKNKSLGLQMRGDGRRVGLFGMMGVATCALHGMPIAELGTALVGEVGPVYADDWASEELAVAGLSVSVPFTPFDAVTLAEAEQLLRIGVTWVGKEALPSPEIIALGDAA